MRTHTRYYAHCQLSCAVWTSAVDSPRSRSNECFMPTQLSMRRFNS